MSAELKVTKEQVLEAFHSCAAARGTLRTLFPTVFEDYDRLMMKTPSMPNGGGNLGAGADVVILRDRGVEVSGVCIRSEGQYKGVGLWLNTIYNWTFELDEHQTLVLVPTRKAGR